MVLIEAKQLTIVVLQLSVETHTKKRRAHSKRVHCVCAFGVVLFFVRCVCFSFIISLTFFTSVSVNRHTGTSDNLYGVVFFVYQALVKVEHSISLVCFFSVHTLNKTIMILFVGLHMGQSGCIIHSHIQTRFRLCFLNE